MKFGQAAVVAESRRDEQDHPMNAPLGHQREFRTENSGRK